jgi:predicted RNase H-like HicB family nuclease
VVAKVSRKTYTARCRRSGDWWAIDVPAVRGVFSQARHLSGVEPMARDAIALMLQVPEDSFDVVVVPQLPGDVSAEVDAARELRESAERQQREATAATTAVARKLVEQHRLRLRDAGRILGLSHQRVHQLLTAPRQG